MRSRVYALLVPLCACNQVLGLGNTFSATEHVDTDQDGIDDARDNCPTTANPDQADRDRDGFGDACDGCPDLATSTNHDEDRDGVGDDCDVCPSIPDFQDDADGDGIGDACDPDPSGPMFPDVRLVFDPFTTVPSDWTQGTPWGSSGDAIGPVAPIMPPDPGLGNKQLVIGIGVPLALGLSATSAWHDETFGVVVHSATSDLVAFCGVHCDAQCTMVAGLGSTPTPGMMHVAPVPLTTLHVTVDFMPFAAPGFGGSYELTCEVGGVSQVAILSSVFVAWWPELVATPNAQMSFIDAVQ